MRRATRGGAGKATQDQNTPFVVPGGHEFFRHQIHAIVQRRYRHKSAAAIVPLNLLMVMLPVQKNDGLPFRRLEPRVDAGGFRFHLRHQIVIAFEVAATWRTNLHECELALIVRILLQKTLNGRKTLRITLV